MFNNYQPYGFNPMQNINQPYANQFNPYMQQAQQNQPQTNTSTNKIFVASIDDVKNRQLPFNSDFIFLDNEKPILYQKTVDSKGQFEIKEFSITPLEIKENPDKYVLKSDFERLESELKELQNKIGETNNG